MGVDNLVPVEGANLIVGDITNPFTQQAVLDAIDKETDVVVSILHPLLESDIDQTSLMLVADVLLLSILKYGGHL